MPIIADLDAGTGQPAGWGHSGGVSDASWAMTYDDTGEEAPSHSILLGLAVCTPIWAVMGGLAFTLLG